MHRLRHLSTAAVVLAVSPWMLSCGGGSGDGDSRSTKSRGDDSSVDCDSLTEQANDAYERGDGDAEERFTSEYRKHCSSSGRLTQGGGGDGG